MQVEICVWKITWTWTQWGASSLRLIIQNKNPADDPAKFSLSLETPIAEVKANEILRDCGVRFMTITWRAVRYIWSYQ